MIAVSYEQVARRLENGDPRELSDRRLAQELGCEEEFIARVRCEGGHALFAPGHRMLRERAEARVRELSRPVDGGHREWTEQTTRDGVPVLSIRGVGTTVGRVAFQMANGRPPVGNVKASCTFPHCVEGTHLTDRPMRARLHGTNNARPCTGCGIPFQPNRKTQKFCKVDCFHEHRAKAAAS
ncbi:hypothetical protein [Streptomyces sp. NPDC056291]|uniref:hypothetical protein n=1 Tax=Streptomyces sp. NPDC056291 TaxID=3345772 RepID=UPI0035DE8331